MMIWLYRMFFLLLPVMLAQAQITQPHRYEKELRFNDHDFMIIPRAAEGLALVRETNTFKGGNRTWEIILLDTTLTERKTLQIEVDQRRNLLGYEHTPEALYLLYGQADNQVRSIFQLFHIEGDSIKSWEIKPEINCVLTQFIRAGKNFLLGGYMNNEPTILLFRPENESLKILPGFFQKDTDLLDLRTNQNNTFTVLLMDRRSRNNRKLLLRIYDSEGVELFHNEISMGERKAPQTCLVSTLQREDMLIAGTWGVPHSRQSLGFFAAPVDPFQSKEPQLYALGELNHYLDHLKETKRRRIQEKTITMMKAGRLPDYLDNVRPIRLEETSKGFILLAEVFIPASTGPRDPMFYPYTFYPWPYPYGFPYNPLYYPPVYNRWYNPFYPIDSSREQDNVKVTRSVVLAFDNQGKLLWDFSYPMEEIRLASVGQMSDFYLSGDSLFILYKRKTNLHVKRINLQNQESKEEVISIELSSTGDELRQEKDRDEYIRYWYGNKFYVWGVQSIRNKTLADDTSRQVFYINAVRIH
ncbi:MAG: hypothetical protein NZM13_11900 [Cyclobacteriaceae bacterium]|nr:hypothetical protein [Cyclobacteriaceae bacterium]MDW8332015.1 hypothetical protein [Cyclobacteriaceae bacterium]